MSTPTEHPAYTVVVGVSDRSASPAALHWAAGHAASRGGHVVAVRAWRPTTPQTGSRVTPAPVSQDAAAGEAAARQRLADDVTRVLGADHGAELRLVVGGRRRVLVDASRGADLLVVDAPGSAELPTSALRLGRLVQGSGCPVVVMPPSDVGEAPTWLARLGEGAARGIARAAGHAGRPGVRPPSVVSD